MRVTRQEYERRRVALQEQRKQKISEMAVQGYSDKEISEAIGCTPRTVSTYRREAKVYKDDLSPDSPHAKAVKTRKTKGAYNVFEDDAAHRRWLKEIREKEKYLPIYIPREASC